MILEPQITYRNVRPTPYIESAVFHEVAKLDRYARHLTGCHVMIEIPHHHRRGPHPYHVRVELTLPGAQVVVGRRRTLHTTAKDLELPEQPRDFNIDIPDRELLVSLRHAFDAARRRLQDTVRRARHATKEHAGMPVGRVARLFTDRGFGFLVADDGHEVYFHRNSVLHGGFDTLHIGNAVRFAEEDGMDGVQASTVALLTRKREGEPMPMYEYRCLDCAKEFSIVESLRQHEAPHKVTCVSCGSNNVERRWSEVAVETSRKS
jgi:putative FmdB family regulatory protein